MLRSRLPIPLFLVTLLVPIAGCVGAAGDTDPGTGESREALCTVNCGSSERTKQIAIEATHACALSTTGHVQCWGANDRGQLGRGTADTYGGAPGLVIGVSDAVEVGVGYDFTCARRQSGVSCWGSHDFDELGVSASTDALIPVDLPGLTNGTQLSVGLLHACLRRSTGTVTCWGWGAASMPSLPDDIVGLTNVVQVAAGNHSSCARLVDGTVKCWGQNTRGEIGLGFTDNVFHPPTTVPNITGATDISALHGSICAVAKGPGMLMNTVFCWGGESAVASPNEGPVTLMAPGVSNASRVVTNGFNFGAVVGSHCALLLDGSVKCWGTDTVGLLGDGEGVTGRGSFQGPTLVAGGRTFQSIATGGDDTCAVDTAGYVWCWGSTYPGLIASATGGDVFVPTYQSDIGW